MREVGYDSAFMFKYSERPGTYASKHLPDNVPEEEKIRRLNELIALQTEISAQQNKKDEARSLMFWWKVSLSAVAHNSVAEQNKTRWWCSIRVTITLARQCV
jgi:tRNA A37 methylthiotransferase MiaB